MRKTILVVDDERDIRLLIQGILEDEGYTVRQAGGAKEAFESVREKRPDLIVLDIWLQGSAQDGLEILDTIKKEHPHVPVLMISGHGTIETAVSAIKKGAYDFIEKPFKADRLLLMIQRALETAQLRRENEQLKAKVQEADHFLGVSPSALTIRQTLEKVAATNSRVLITGAPGTGKNVAARTLHHLSKRKDGPFYTVNCVNLHPDHFEIELFGSDAGTRQKGALELANGGTLYLDEVGDMPLETQGKIVRALQEEKFRRKEGSEDIPVDLRIIASTNKSLEQEIKERRFREDLYYRLNVVPVHIPALKDRPQDIPVLADFFIEQCALQSDLKPRTISEQTMAVLQSFDWPGNARQLKNVIEWLLIMARQDRDTIDPDHLPPDIKGENRRSSGKNIQPANDYAALPLKEAREEFERRYLSLQLNRFGGNISKTAQFVGMERSALHRKMKSLDILGTEKQDRGADDSKINKRA